MDDDILEATVDTLSIAKRLGTYLVSRASTDELKEIGQQVVLRADKLSEKLQLKRTLPHIEVANIPQPSTQNSTISHITNSRLNILPHIEVSEKNGSNLMRHNAMTGQLITQLPSIPVKQRPSTRKFKQPKTAIRNTITHNTRFPYNGQKINAEAYYATASVPNTVAAAAGGARRRTRRR
jgi:hypothetical protein